MCSTRRAKQFLLWLFCVGDNSCFMVAIAKNYLEAALVVEEANKCVIAEEEDRNKDMVHKYTV